MLALGEWGFWVAMVALGLTRMVEGAMMGVFGGLGMRSLYVFWALRCARYEINRFILALQGRGLLLHQESCVGSVVAHF